MDKHIAIETKGLEIGYRSSSGHKKTLFDNLNLKLYSSELTTLMGVNGSGKSTLIKTICGLIPKLSGEIVINGVSLNEISKKELSNHISIVLTDRVSDGGLTVYDLVSMGRYPYTGFFGKLSKEDISIIEYCMEIIGISAMRNIPISRLSDGERQKVMIAKSLCQQSDIIILDEPTAFLDIKSRIEIMRILRSLAKSEKRAFLISSHDLELSLQYSDKLWILSNEDGMIMGDTEEVVLSGNIDKVIKGGEELRFDYSTGVFFSSQKPSRYINLSGEDTLWVRNALRRADIGIDYSFAAEITIKVNDYSNIDITKNGDTIRVFSISDMLQLLEKL